MTCNCAKVVNEKLAAFMEGEMTKPDVYLATIDRLEPDIAMIDPGAFYASAAISLKRIADALEALALDTIAERATAGGHIDPKTGIRIYPEVAVK